MIQDLTEGRPAKVILVYSLPIILGNVFQQIYNLADIIIVGQLIGKNAIASIGATNSISFFFFAAVKGKRKKFIFFLADKFIVC